MILLISNRKKNKSKKERTVKAEVGSKSKKNIDSIVQNSSYFVLEQCSQKIQTVSCPPSESPYSKSEDGVYDHLRDKKSRKPEVEDTYQHASAGVSRDMSEYDTMANVVNKKLEEDASYDYSYQSAKGNYACDLRAKNNLTDNPYDVAV